MEYRDYMRGLRARAHSTWTIVALVLGLSALTTTPGCGGGGTNDNPIVSIALDPISGQLMVGATNTLQLTATATRQDGTTEVVTSGLTWTSSDITVAIVSNAGSVSPASTPGTAQITASATNGDGTTITSSPAVITVVESSAVAAIDVQPPTAMLNEGTTRQLSATARFDNGTTMDVTGQAVWTSQDTGIVTVSSAGLATAEGEGVTSVDATYGGKTGSATITVNATTLDAIVVTPANPSAQVGTTVSFTAMGMYSNGTSQDITGNVTWESATTSVATITTAGVATAHAEGSTIVSAKMSGLTGVSTLSVSGFAVESVVVTPASPSLRVGESLGLTATANFFGGSTQDVTSTASWTTGDGGVVSVSSTGVVLGVAEGGPVAITATFMGVPGTTAVTVSGVFVTDIVLSPASPAPLPIGLTQAFTAEATYSDGSKGDITDDPSLTFTTTVESVAAVSNAAVNKGLATGMGIGTTLIGADFNDGSGPLSATPISLSVTDPVVVGIAATPDRAFFPVGVPTNFICIGTFSDGSSETLTDQLTWASDDETTATVLPTPGGEGQVLGHNPGMVNISCSQDGVTEFIPVHVTDLFLERIVVTPEASDLPEGLDVQYTAIGHYEGGVEYDITQLSTWDVVQPTCTGCTGTGPFLGVSNVMGSEGLVSGLVSTFDPGLGSGGAFDPGQVTATLDGITGAVDVTVSSDTLVDIDVRINDVDDVASPALTAVPVDLDVRAFATCTWADGHSTDCSQDVTFTTDYADVTIDNTAGPTKGIITGVYAGYSVNISTDPIGSATVNQLPLFITDCGFDFMFLDVASGFSATVPRGGTTQTNAMLGYNKTSCSYPPADHYFTNNSIVSWSSDSPMVMTADSTGLVTTSPTAANGYGYITSSFADGVSGPLSSDLQITVTDAELVNIEVFAPDTNAGNSFLRGTCPMNSPDETTSLLSEDDGAAFPVGRSVPFIAIGEYTDGSVWDITMVANWTSSNGLSATVDAEGVVTGNGDPGTTIISASVSGLSGSMSLDVVDAVLTDLEIYPVMPYDGYVSGNPVAWPGDIRLGASVPLSAQGQFPTSAQLPVDEHPGADMWFCITEDAVWNTADTNVASVDSQGYVTGNMVGTTTVDINYGGFTDEVTITVTDAAVVSLEIIPETESLVEDDTVQLIAVANLADGSRVDLTYDPQTDWGTPTGLGLAQDNTTGLYRGVQAGESGTVDVCHPDGVSGMVCASDSSGTAVIDVIARP